MSYWTSKKILITGGKGFLGTRLIENKANGKSKGYGFVEMTDRDEAAEAIKALNGKEIKGRALVVNEAKSRPKN